MRSARGNWKYYACHVPFKNWKLIRRFPSVRPEAMVTSLLTFSGSRSRSPDSAGPTFITYQMGSLGTQNPYQSQHISAQQVRLIPAI